MSSEVALALIGLLGEVVKAIAPVIGTIAACGAAYVSYRNGKKVDINTSQISENTAKVDAVRSVADETRIIAGRAENKAVMLEDTTRKALDFMSTNTFEAGKLAGMLEERKNTDFGELHKR